MINVSRKSKTAARHNTVLHSLLPSCALSAAICVALTSPAYADQARKAYDIQPKPLAEALLELSEVTDTMVMVPDGLLRDKQSPQLKGEFSLGQALDILLSGSGLSYNFGDDGSVRIGAAAEEEKTESGQSDDKESDVDEEIIVTGSRIARTPSQMAANVIVLDNRTLMASGETTLEGALRQLPQNIFGATPTGAAVDGSGMSFNGALNITGASSINLRGLGGESTLVLVDGNRIGKSGIFGGVSDITGIPLRSVERVEIILDGVSSIYGSDAVGGVVNVITKKDFEGGEFTYEHAHSKLGGFEENVFSINASKPWDSGRIHAVFEHFHRSNLDGGERPENFTRGTSSTSPGAIVGVEFFRRGSEIVSFGELRQTYSRNEILDMIRGGELIRQDVFLPPNQDGLNLSQDDLIFVDDNPQPGGGEGISIKPRQSRSTLRLGFDQELQFFGQEMILRGNAEYSQRQTYASNGPYSISAFVFPDYAASLFPGEFYIVNWGIPGWADQHYDSDQTVARWNLSLDGDFGERWRWNMAAGQSRDNIDSLYLNVPVNGFSSDYFQLLDDGLNIHAGDLLAANSPELIERLIVPEVDVVALNTENTFGVNANGTLWSLPGGDIHLAIGIDWRQEGLEAGARKRVGQSSLDGREIGSLDSVSIPRTFDDADVSRTQRSGFAELLVPIVGTDNTLPGVQRLNLTGAARYDSYHEQGSDSTWSLGVIWNPVEQITFKVNHSTSFVVPTFREQLTPTREIDYTTDPLYTMQGRPYPVVDIDGNLTGETEFMSRRIIGGNPNLEPETASSQTAGIEITPDILPGFTLRATWHHTEYKNRIGGPPTIVELVAFNGIGQSAFLADSGYETKYGTTLYRDENGALVWDRRSVNTSQIERSGIDYWARYNRDTDYGRFIATVNIGYTSKYNRVLNAGDEPVNQVKSVTFASRAVVPAYRYSAQLLWSFRGISASLNASTSSSTESLSDITRRIANYPLRMDFSIAYDLDEGNLFSVPGWLQGTEISLKIPRLLNDTTDYQILDITTGEPVSYAELNANVADPIGRMVHVSLTKRF